jgi:NAD(P)-dependent dehydrogenase (short-subunit alcohol dehydrogenase family)
VLSFTEALWAETRASAVRVLALCPGPTQTRFFETAGNGNSPAGLLYFYRRRALRTRLGVGGPGAGRRQRGPDCLALAGALALALAGGRTAVSVPPADVIPRDVPRGRPGR